ncbi:H+ transporting ATP synthase subunit e [Danaus plexippus plexippus]|uniref:H+ transporting ATP synthase subunit e n=1 Tax=Danaus plexippus plexippus TaxID=278856 RepID=A0A212ET16_DANPL|nr:H+ transporting ATP synthase subunit e [Danaus plexippus plexippus]
MSLPYGPPVLVSPLIRGIIYGRIKQKRYEKQEEIWREEEAERKILRDRQLAKLKARIAIEENEALKKLETGELFEEL